MKALIKIQYVDSVAKNPRAAKMVVGTRLKNVDKKGLYEHTVEMLDLGNILEREIGQLSGGELQRFVIGLTCVQKAHIYMFDEPSSYLDVKQRLKAGRMIRSMLEPGTYVICVEHDLAILDYLSDFICCLYGTPGAYGVVTMPMSVRQGINVFLAGYIPTENMRFRDIELNFKVSEQEDQRDLLGENAQNEKTSYEYPTMTKTLGAFKLSVEAGKFKPSECMMMLG